MTWSPHNTIAVDDDVETWSDVEIISDKVLPLPAGNTRPDSPSFSIADPSPPTPAKVEDEPMPKPQMQVKPDGKDSDVEIIGEVKNPGFSDLFWF